MKLDFRPVLALALALSVPPGPAFGATHAAQTVRIAGHEYLRLSDWARANELALSWVKRDETLQLSNADSRLLLQLHTPEVWVNGIKVRLLFPLAQQNETVFLSQADAQNTLRPLLSPPRELTGAKLASICLDPGHGGKDPGFIVGSNAEKRYTLLLALELRDQLKRAGWKVTMTRTTDTALELPTRPAAANRQKADLFVSLHFNSVENSPTTVQGTEVYCLTPAGAPSSNSRGEGGSSGWFTGNKQNDQNLLLAYELQQALTRGLGTEDRGVHRARYWVLRDATMPAVLVEAGYMSHPNEGRKIFTAAYRRQIAQAIVNGLAAYKKVVERR
jgi:N-acetylmuramoyl-L-alanine amidase